MLRGTFSPYRRKPRCRGLGDTPYGRWPSLSGPCDHTVKAVATYHKLVGSVPEKPATSRLFNARFSAGRNGSAACRPLLSVPHAQLRMMHQCLGHSAEVIHSPTGLIAGKPAPTMCAALLSPVGAGLPAMKPPRAPDRLSPRARPRACGGAKAVGRYFRNGLHATGKT